MSAARPNLLVIHTDQQSWWTLGCYGGTLVDTPHTDRLAAEGARFRNFFTNSAVCTPSRGCFLTGRYPQAHGAQSNDVPLNRDEITFAEVLRRSGYRTGYAGKWHLDGKDKPGWMRPERAMGFQDVGAMFNRGHWKAIHDPAVPGGTPTVKASEVGDASTYTTDWLTAHTIRFLETAAGAPFCFMLSIPDPHIPVTVRKPYDTMYDPANMPLPATWNDPALPDWAVEIRDQGPYAPAKPDRESRLRRFLAGYCGEVKLIDDCIGRLRQALERLGILEDTVVVFTTDHGDYAGEHGLQAKNHLYETAYRLPLIIRWPERIRGGVVLDQVVSTVDFQPTILRLMGLEPCGREQGRDASPLLAGRDAPWDNSAFIYHSHHHCAGIFTEAFELALVKGRQSMLFDRIRDPHQMRNLFDDPGYAAVRDALIRRVVEHHAAYQSPAAEWLARAPRA